MTADVVMILDADLQPARMEAELETGPDTGARVVFTGAVRGEGGQVSAVYLECYDAMARRTLHQLIAAARERWPLQQVVVAHRKGEVRLGEVIVYVAVSASHRKSAFDACAFLMDYLKTAAPFWKKEIGPGGEHWVEARQRDQAAWQRWLPEDEP